MSNRRLLDRMVTPEWMSTALRIARMDKPWAEARQLLDVALRDEIEAKTGRRKTATVLAGSWLKPAPEARALVEWAKEHASGDMRVWHLGVLMANYSFFGHVCAEIGRALGLAHDVDTRLLRSSMKSEWGDRDAVNVATRSAVRTLRSFGCLLGENGDSTSEIGPQLTPERATVPWLFHALMVARGIRETDLREALTAPELFMFNLPPGIDNGYPHIERFTEGSGRIVVGIVTHHKEVTPPTKQLSLNVDVPDQLEPNSNPRS